MSLKTLARYSAYITLLLFFIVYFLNGTFFQNNFSVTDKTGLLESSLGQRALPALGPRLSGSVLQQQMSRKDYLFWVEHEYSLNFIAVSGIPGADSINYRVSLPGKVIETNADDPLTLTWNKLPQNGLMEASSRYVRWWLIILTFFIAAFNVYAIFIKKEN